MTAELGHEPECYMLDHTLCDEKQHVMSWDKVACTICGIHCTCTPLRLAFFRGMEDAAKVADHRKDELGWCSKLDRCHTMAQGADLAASDIRFRAGVLRTRWEQS